ncbi:pyridoxamine 5'-phosphate oxidase family protein [Pseudomonas sp. PS1]|uniref:Pyridoxamine 5'-phosphate oxidase family protein n=1 Tax=Stutzerimonas marianensis TaxID=2929513 RepID=A0A9X1W1H3_9GAMM|nr:pyridoxamine 5'-phosphate oxidase family protein [Pseudomonas marianensis]MCJ0972775.1 pyridoxamine 5'-phosphate oxidase family protein [Pseudomonas marianensis]
MNTPFHDGERWVQARVGVQEKMAQIGSRVIRPFMPEQHRQFFACLPTLLLGAADADGQPHASIIWGSPGFVWSPHPQVLSIAARLESDDPIAACLSPRAAVGVLGLSWHTRRRNRANGRIVERDADGLSVAVAQSFGNCPKYIQARPWRSQARTAGDRLGGVGPDSAWLELVGRSDTLFIASGSAGAEGCGLDVSHRGGPSGFVEVADDGRLWLPDYSGNQFFNTLGNLVREPRCGLLFIDFASGDLLQIQAHAEVVWPQQYGAHGIVAAPGAERMVVFTPARWALRRARLPLSFGAPECSPFLPQGSR